MSFSTTLLRARRKYRSDGSEALLAEITTKGLESKLGRAFVRQQLLTDMSILEQSQLREQATRAWECKPSNSSNPFDSEIPISKKTRLSNSQSFEGLETRLPTSPFVAELQDITVLGPSGLGITPNSQLIKDTVASDRSSASRLEKILSRSILQNGYRKTRDVVRSPSTHGDWKMLVATTLVPVWQNYYHWTLECLPKLLGIETYYEQTGESPTILLPPNPPSWMRESFELISANWAETTSLQSGTAHVSQFVVPSYPSPSRTECFWLRDRAHDAVGITKQDNNTFPSRIYVTRRNANVRRVKNEKKVLKILSEFNIRPYALETLTVAEQIRLFSNADLVVAPHGAGLANLVYSTSPTVVELFGYKEKTTFYRLSKIMGHEYHAIFCENKNQDIIVDTNKLLSKIENVIK